MCGLTDSYIIMPHPLIEWNIKITVRKYLITNLSNKFNYFLFYYFSTRIIDLQEILI